MSLTEITGDLFEVQGLDALAHGVNCRGLMGAGIALKFRDLYPAMYLEYATACREKRLIPGGLFPWRNPPGKPWIYNLATQDDIGRCARIKHVRASVRVMYLHARDHGVRHIGMPRIGSGIGGLSWDSVRAALADEIGDSLRVDVVVVSLPEKKR